MTSLRILLLLLLTGCGGADGPPLAVSELRVVTPTPDMHAAYLNIRNNTSEPLRITAIESPHYERVEIHESLVDNDVARMRKRETLEIPAGESVELLPGGLHLMLIKPQSSAGSVSLAFFQDDALLLSVAANRQE